MAKILLIAADWHLRALVRAQLQEEGFEVKALPELEMGLAYLIRSGEQPLLTILDAQASEFDAQMASDLWQLTGKAPLILCGGALNRHALTQESLPPAQVLLRPFRVGDLVGLVRSVLACPEAETTAE